MSHRQVTDHHELTHPSERLGVVRGELRGAFAVLAELAGAWEDDGVRMHALLTDRIRSGRRRAASGPPLEAAEKAHREGLLRRIRRRFRRRRKPGRSQGEQPPESRAEEQQREHTARIGPLQAAHRAEMLELAQRAARAEIERAELQVELQALRQRLMVAEAYAERCRRLDGQFSWEIVDA